MWSDFYDKKLTPKDCLAEGGTLSPLLKRISYEHEKELRAFIVPKFDPINILTQIYKSI
jgi:hypothetical protein